jgi:prevent-host-death family protein
MVMKVNVTEFKARCTNYLRRLGQMGEPLEVTNRGRVVAVITAPAVKADDNPAWGALAGSLIYMADDFDEPLGEGDWEASQ